MLLRYSLQLCTFRYTAFGPLLAPRICTCSENFLISYNPLGDSGFSLSAVALLSVDNPNEVAFGGKHIHLQQLAKGLQATGVSVHTLYLTTQERERQEQCLRKLPMARLRRNWERWTKHTPTRLERLLTRIDAMATHYAQPSLYQVLPTGTVLNPHDAICAAKIPLSAGRVVLTLHGYLSREMVNYNPDLSEPDAKKLASACDMLDRQAFRRADQIIAVDTRIRETLIDAYAIDPGKITVIHNAVDTERFQPVSSSEQAVLKQKLGLDPEIFMALCPRRLVKKNGVIVAVQAWQALQDSALHLVIIGDGPEQAAIEDALKTVDPGSYTLLPALAHQEILPWYQAADVILVPSVTADGVQEATSLTMLEGMACGKPVLCSDIGGMREVLSQTREGQPIGIRVPEGDAQALLTAVQDLAHHPARCMALGESAHRFVATHHSIANHTEQFRAVYAKKLLYS